MIYVFLGIDFNVVKKKIDELISKLNINNIIKYDFSETNIRDILDEVNYIDLFNEQKLVIVSNFSFKKLKDKDEELLKRYIENMNDNIIILRCIDESLDERKSIIKLLKSNCKVEEVKKLDYKELHEYVTNMLKENNINANYNQVKKILDLCEYNTDYTISEVEKLILYKYGQNELYDKDIDEVITKSTEKEIFSFTENVLKKDVAASLKSYNILMSKKKMDEILLIDSLEKQFRLLFQTKELRSKMDEVTLSRSLGVNPYVIKKLYPYLNSYSLEDIANILYKLSNMDIDVKMNGYDKRHVLETFLISL